MNGAINIIKPKSDYLSPFDIEYDILSKSFDNNELLKDIYLKVFDKQDTNDDCKICAVIDKLNDIKDILENKQFIVEKEKPVYIDKIVYKEVEKEKIIYKDKIVYKDRVIEKPVIKVVYKYIPKPSNKDNTTTNTTNNTPTTETIEKYNYINKTCNCSCYYINPIHYGKANNKYGHYNILDCIGRALYSE